MMDLSTRYLGLRLANPFVPGASPLTGDLAMACRLEDAGAAALVLPSLFEEDIVRREAATGHYLEHLLRLKRRVRIPVIASLNGTSREGWLHYAHMIERAGANALELNFYHVATDLTEDGRSIEDRVVDIVAVLKESITIPLAVKLSPFYSSLPHLAAQVDRLGVDGLVLFNRFYQPDINPERQEATLQLALSDPSELLLRLRWVAILAGRVNASLAVTGGVHSAIDVVKAIMAGADCVQLVSTLLEHGPERLALIRRDFERWADAHACWSVGELRGLVSHERSSNPATFERGNYIRLLQSWRRPDLWIVH
jgi:dihydroorotate dehydrogenase (fumarate)